MAEINSINSFAGNNTFRKNNEFGMQSKQNKYRKAAIGVSSFMLPGTGQIINNENTKGFALLAADVLSFVTFLTAKRTYKAAAFFPWLVNIAIKCWAAVDAYEGAE